MKKYYALIIFLLIFVAGIYLRATPAVFERDYWYDEAFTGILLQQPWGEMNQMIFDDVHPPLYYWLAKPWSGPFDYSPFGIRTFSILFGLATIISIYWIGKRMFSERAGLLAAVFTAFSPFAIEYSQEARMYALFGFLMLWAVWFFYRALEDNKMKDWILWGIFCGLSFYTHYLALFFFVIFFVTYLVYRYIFINQKNKNKIKGFFAKLGLNSWGLWIGIGIIFLFFLSWIKIFISHMAKGNLGWIDPSYLSDIPKTLQIFFFGHPAGTGGVPWPNKFKFFFDEYSAGLIILSLILVIFTILWIKNKKRKEMLILSMLSLGTLIFLILLSHVNIKLYVARYFMPAAILIYLLLAGLLTEVSAKKWIWLIALGFYGLLLFNLSPMTYNSNWNLIYEKHKDRVFLESEKIVTTNVFDYTSARYYFGKDNVKYYNKNNPQEDFTGWVVVGNENRITESNDINENPGWIIVDNECNLEGVNFSKMYQAGDLIECRVK